MKRTKSGFHFQPFADRELTQTDNAPLLFNSQPPGRNGRVTVFLKTRRTLRRRLGVHDPGQIESVLQDRERDITHDELKTALNRRTEWRYLFPPDTKTEAEERVDSDDFSALLERTLAPAI